MENNSETKTIKAETLETDTIFIDKKGDLFFKPIKTFQIDMDKVKTLEDVKRIIEVVDLKVNESYKNIDKIKHLLKK